MSAPRRVSVALPAGAQRMTLVVEGEGWQHRQQLVVEDGREWRVVFAANRMEAVSAARNRADQAHIVDLQSRLAAAPEQVRREMREWMSDRRMRLATITAPDLAAASSELQRRLAAAADGVAVPAPGDASSAGTAATLDGEAASPVEAGTATVPKPFAEMSLPELIVEVQARGVEGSFDDRDELVEFLEQLAAEEQQPAGEGDQP